MNVTPSFFDRNLILVDICDYLDGNKYPTNKLYFYSHTYPPPRDNKLMIDTTSGIPYSLWLDLKRDICKSAHETGKTLSVLTEKGYTITLVVLSQGTNLPMVWPSRIVVTIATLHL